MYMYSLINTHTQLHTHTNTMLHILLYYTVTYHIVSPGPLLRCWFGWRYWPFLLWLDIEVGVNQMLQFVIGQLITRDSFQRGAIIGQTQVALTSRYAGREIARLLQWSRFHLRRQPVSSDNLGGDKLNFQYTAEGVYTSKESGDRHGLTIRLSGYSGQYKCQLT